MDKIIYLLQDSKSIHLIRFTFSKSSIFTQGQNQEKKEKNAWIYRIFLSKSFLGLTRVKTWNIEPFCYFFILIFDPGQIKKK